MARSNPITAERLRNILDCRHAQEYTDFDLKSAFGTRADLVNRTSKRAIRLDMARDIIAMANTYSKVRAINESSYIVIGVNEDKKLGQNGRFNADIELDACRELFNSDDFVKAIYDNDICEPNLPPIYYHEAIFDKFHYDGTIYKNIKLAIIEVTPTFSICRIKRQVQLGSTTYAPGTVLYRDAATTRIADQAKIADLTAEKEAAWGRLNVEQAPDKARQFLYVIERQLTQKFLERPGEPQIQEHFLSRSLRGPKNEQRRPDDPLNGVILGGPGSGKSSQLIHEAWLQAKSAISALQRPSPDLSQVMLPVYITAKDLTESLRSNSNVISACVDCASASASEPDPLLQAWLATMLRAGQWLLAIDAWDSASAAQRAALTSALSSLKATSPDCRLLVASQPEAADESLRRVFHKQVWTLDPLPRWREAVYSWAPEEGVGKRALAGQAIAQLQTLDDGEYLWGNPLLLRLACDAVWHPHGGGGALQRRTDLYKHFVAALQSRWASAVHPDYTLEDCFAPFLNALALAWDAQPPDNRPSLAVLSREARRVALFGQEDRDVIGDLLKSGLFVRSGHGQFEPLHPTLLEFLVARAWAKTPDGGQQAFARPPLQLGPRLWMLAGQLETPVRYRSYIQRLAELCAESFDKPNRDASDQYAERLAETLLDCLYEAPPGCSVSGGLPGELITRLLDARQRKERHSIQGEWECLMERDLVLRSLSVVARTSSGATPPLAFAVREMLRTFLGQMNDLAKRWVLRNPSAVPIAEWHSQLLEILSCDHPTIRWAGLWLVTSMSLHNIPVAPELWRVLRERAKTDPCSSCQALATRALGRILPLADALDELQQALKSGNMARSVAACHALSKMQSQKTLEILLAHGAGLMNQPEVQSRIELARELVAVIGALEHFVEVQLNQRQRETGKQQNFDNIQIQVRQSSQLRVLLRWALTHPHPKAHGSAASALGKLGDLQSRPALQAIVDRPDEQYTKARASAMFGLQELCDSLPQKDWPQAAAWLRKIATDKQQPMDVRRPALSALGRLAERGEWADPESTKAIQALTTCLQDAAEEPGVKTSAAYALVRFQDEAPAAFYLTLILAQEEPAQVGAAALLRQLGSYPNVFSLRRLAAIIGRDGMTPQLLAMALHQFNSLCEQYRCHDRHRDYPAQVEELRSRLATLAQHPDPAVARAANFLRPRR